MPDVSEFCEENHEVTDLAWHPSKKLLLVGIITGDIRLWNGQSDFINVASPHSSPIKIFKWSELGTRLVSVDMVIKKKKKNLTYVITKLKKKKC